MIHLYGIPNCDTTQKAIKWLQKQSVEFTFHDYKLEGVSSATLHKWLRSIPLSKLLNQRSTTYRELPAHDKEGVDDTEKAIDLMIRHNSLIKRPLIDFGNDNYVLGWNEQEMSALLGITR